MNSVIGISGTNYAFLIDSSALSPVETQEARVSRSPTLDGNCSLGHYGFSHGDRILTIQGRLTQVVMGYAKSIFQNDTLVHLSLDDGCFYGAMETFQDDGGIFQSRILIKELTT